MQKSGEGELCPEGERGLDAVWRKMWSSGMRKQQYTSIGAGSWYGKEDQAGTPQKEPVDLDGWFFPNNSVLRCFCLWSREDNGELWKSRVRTLYIIEPPEEHLINGVLGVFAWQQAVGWPCKWETASRRKPRPKSDLSSGDQIRTVGSQNSWGTVHVFSHLYLTLYLQKPSPRLKYIIS